MKHLKYIIRALKEGFENKLNNESNITRDESMDILHEFEMLLVDN